MKLPARDDLSSSSPKLNPVGQTLQNRICEVSGLSGRVLSLDSQMTPPKGYYFLHDDRSGLPFFIKILESKDVESQVLADSYASYLKSNGLRVNSIVDGFPKHFDCTHRLVVYQWIEGSFLNVDQNTMEILGRRMGQMHAAFSQYDFDSVKNKSAEKLLALETFSKELMQKRFYCGPYAERVERLLQSMPDAFSNFDEPCQIVHGDLNVGNVLWTGDDVVFLDFEDTSSSWLPRRIEVAFALERLILINEANDESALKVARSFLRAYVKAAGSSPFQEEGELISSLYWLSLRSLVMLTQYELEGFPWPESEWQKFGVLLDHIDRRKVMMSQLESEFISCEVI